MQNVGFHMTRLNYVHVTVISGNAMKGEHLLLPQGGLEYNDKGATSCFCIYRPVYIGSCACVVKIVVKCSFEYLSVVHHTRRHPTTINIM